MILYGDNVHVALVQTVYTGGAANLAHTTEFADELDVPCGGLFNNCWIRAIQIDRTTHCADLPIIGATFLSKAKSPRLF